MEKNREIYIKIDKTKEVVNLLKRIKAKEQEIQNLFNTYDRLNIQENKIFENWNSNLDDIITKLDHVTL
ncbi:MAG: hypothetical protein ACOC16_00915 [Nanoarchaeota archaeon]